MQLVSSDLVSMSKYSQILFAVIDNNFCRFNEIIAENEWNVPALPSKCENYNSFLLHFTSRSWRSCKRTRSIQYCELVILMRFFTEYVSTRQTYIHVLFEMTLNRCCFLLIKFTVIFMLAILEMNGDMYV